MTKAQASQRYLRLTEMASCVADEDDFYSQQFDVARNNLNIFSVVQSGGTTPAVMQYRLKVCETMSDMLPARSPVFTVDYYTRPTFSVKVFYNVAELYGFNEVPGEFLPQLFLNDYERAHKTPSFVGVQEIDHEAVMVLKVQKRARWHGVRFDVLPVHVVGEGDPSSRGWAFGDCAREGE